MTFSPRLLPLDGRPPMYVELINSSSWSSLRSMTPRRKSVTAKVVPPVETHCLLNPEVLVSDAGNGVRDEM